MTAEMFSFILMTYLTSIVFASFIYFLGHFVLEGIYHGKGNIYNMGQSIFVKTLIGLFLIVVITAIVFSKGKTMFFVPLIGMLFAIVLFKSKEVVNKTTFLKFSFISEFKKAMSVIVISTSVIYLLVYWTSFSIEFFPYFSLSRDDIFYAQVAHHIKLYGAENTYLDWGVQAKELGIYPYHYFESYLIIFFSTILKISNNHILLFVSFPIMSSILVTGIMTFYKKNKFNNLIIVLFSVIVFQFFHYNFKIMSCIIVFTLIIAFYFEKHYSKAIIALVLLPLLNFGQLPLILVLLLTLIVFLLLNKKFDYLKYAIYAFVISLSYFFIINVFKGSIEGLSSGIGIKTITDYYLSDLMRVKTSIHISLSLFLERLNGNIFQFILLIFIIIAVMAIEKFAMYKKIIYILLSYLILSLVLSGVFSFLADTAQMFYLYFSFLMFIPFIFLLELFGDKKAVVIGVSIISIFFLFEDFTKNNPKTNKLYFESEKYSTEYLDELKLNKGSFNGKGARYTNTDIMSAYAINPNCHSEGYPLSFIRNGLEINTLNLLDIKPQPSLHNFFNFNKSLIVKSTYLNNDFSNKGPKVSWEELDEKGKEDYYLDFIDRHNIQYIFINRLASVPKSVSSMFSKKIIDSKSGEHVLFNPIK